MSKVIESKEKLNEKDTRWNKRIRKLSYEGILPKKDAPNIKEWEKFLVSLPKSIDPYVKSKNRYKCRMHSTYYDWKFKLEANLYGAAKILSGHVKSLVDRLKGKQDEDYVSPDKDKYDMVVLTNQIGIKDIFPEELYKQYENVYLLPKNRHRLQIRNPEYKDAYKKLARKNPFNFYYKYLAKRELALQSYIKENFNPEVVVTHLSERNPVDSIIKEIMEKEDKKYIGYMHGEDLLHLYKAHMSYSKYYVWFNEYAKMYKDRFYADIGEYVEFTPGKFKQKYPKQDKYDKDIIYYIGSQNKEAKLILKNIIRESRKRGINFVIRTHPRVHFDKKGWPEEYFEEQGINYVDSIRNTRIVAGISTTTLIEALKRWQRNDNI